MERLKAKVCIVGSGVAGCLTAKHLISSAKDILIIERGGRVTHEKRMKQRRHEIPLASSAHAHVVTGDFSDKKIQYVYAAGGATNHWMGQTPRFLAQDFRMKSQFGIAEDWPLDYEELEPYYTLAEQELSIAGDENPRIPRSADYPLPAHPYSPADLLFKKCFPEGSIVAVPQARPTRPVGNRPACCASATCGLCPVDSKYTPMNSHIPELEATSGVRFLYQTAVVELKSDGNRNIRQAIARDNRKKEFAIEADIFILAANAIENPAILLRSTALHAPPETGRYLFDHPNFTITARLSQDGYPYFGNSLFTGHCYEFYDGDFRKTRASALGEIPNIPNLQAAYFAVEAAEKNLSGKKLRAYVGREFRKQITMNFLLEDLPDARRSVKVRSDLGPLGIPKTEIQYTHPSEYVYAARDFISKKLPTYLSPLQVRNYVISDFQDNAGHLVGTCRMGRQGKSVVDAALRYHEFDNLYVVGGSAFPTYSASNPTLTIAALALRLAKHLA